MSARLSRFMASWGAFGLLLNGCAVPQPPDGSVPAAPGLAAPAAAAGLGAGPSGLKPDVDHMPDQLIVSLAPGADAATVLADPAASGVAVLARLPVGESRLLVVKVPAGTLAEARARLMEVPGVLAVSLNTVAHAHVAAAADPRYGEQWAHAPGFGNTQAAWTRLAGVDQTKVAVAMIDTGCDVDHEEFAGRIIAPFNSVIGTDLADDEVGDPFGHGTFTTGIMGASGDNGKGIAGVAWKVKIMPIKADHLDVDTAQFGAFALADIVNGLKYAIDHADQGATHVRVINMSLGQDSAGLEPLYVEAIRYARTKGILVVASSGNSGERFVPPPANSPGVLAVGSTSHHGPFEYLSAYSNYGDRVDLVAPGDGILSTVPLYTNALGNRNSKDLRSYAYGSGTSEAAPYASGVAALVFAKYDPGNASLASPETAGAMVDKVRAHLLKSVDDLGPPGWDPSYGWGRINADMALSPATLRE